MSDTPEHSKQPEEQASADSQPTPPKKVGLQEPSKPSSPASSPKPNPVSIGSGQQQSAPTTQASIDSSISFDDDDDDFDAPTKMSPVGLAVDGVAAVVAITFAVLILMDVLPFLK